MRKLLVKGKRFKKGETFINAHATVSKPFSIGMKKTQRRHMKRMKKSGM